MTGKAEWGLRSYQDEPDTESWGGENVYDVYSLVRRHQHRRRALPPMVSGVRA